MGRYVRQRKWGQRRAEAMAARDAVAAAGEEAENGQ